MAIETDIVAYTERDSIDPESCEEGITRTEWRIVEGDFYQDRDPYRRRRFRLADTYRRAYTDFRLERRTIRRSEDLGWQPIEICDNQIEPLLMVDNLQSASVIAVDPEFAEIQETYRQRVRESKDEETRKEAREREDMERRRQRVESEDAFRRLYESETGKVWAEEWNTFTTHARPDVVATLRKDKRAVALHDAVIAAVTVPAKRKAIREALTYFEQVLTQLRS